MLAATLMLALVFAVLLLADAFSLRSAILSRLSGGETESGADEGFSAGIPVIDREEEEPDYVFFEITDENALDNIVPAPCYTRAMTVSYGWGERDAERQWTLEVDGDCWRLYSEPDEIFCDGERIYAFCAGFASLSEGTAWEPEVGAADLAEIRRCVDDPDYAADISAGERTVQVRTVSVNHLKDFFEIDLSSGLILTEICRYDTDTIRSITTDSLILRENPTPREQYEERAAAFLEAHPDLTP